MVHDSDQFEGRDLEQLLNSIPRIRNLVLFVYPFGRVRKANRRLLDDEPRQAIPWTKALARLSDENFGATAVFKITQEKFGPWSDSQRTANAPSPPRPTPVAAHTDAAATETPAASMPTNGGWQRKTR